MITTTTNTRPRPGLLTDLRDCKRIKMNDQVGTLSLITPAEEKSDPLSVEFIEDRDEKSFPTPLPLTPDSGYDDALPKELRYTDDEDREQWFVGAIDQGTTSSRFLIFNNQGEPVANYQLEFEQHYPQSG